MYSKCVFLLQMILMETMCLIKTYNNHKVIVNSKKDRFLCVNFFSSAHYLEYMMTDMVGCQSSIL